jgi:hypothetical protein
VIVFHEKDLLAMAAADDISGKAYINSLQNIFVIYFPLAVLGTLLVGTSSRFRSSDRSNTRSTM